MDMVFEKIDKQYEYIILKSHTKKKISFHVHCKDITFLDM